MFEKPLSEFGQQDPQRHSQALNFGSRQFAEPSPTQENLITHRQFPAFQWIKVALPIIKLDG